MHRLRANKLSPSLRIQSSFPGLLVRGQKAQRTSQQDPFKFGRGPKATTMRTLRILTIVTGLICFASAQPAPAQVNMQYNGQYSGQYTGQYGGQVSSQFSGQYYGRGVDETASPTARDWRYGISGYPVNSGECGELHYPSPGTDYVFHDSQGRRCY
jgi:hypothetical protein